MERAETGGVPSGRRGRPSPSESRHRMTELLFVARQEFVRRGYRSTKMDDIAQAAGVTKRTLYLWHDNKAALFRACIEAGAARFPQLDIASQNPPQRVLEDFFYELLREMSQPDSFGMGRLLVQQGDNFPELLEQASQSYHDLIIAPFSAYLRQLGRAADVADREADLIITMAMAPVHNGLLLGRDLPDAAELRRHSAFVARYMLKSGGGDPV